jgi:HSP20 family protein
MTLLFSDPVESLMSLQRELDSFLHRSHPVASGTLGVFPPINVFSDREGLVVMAEVPGISPDTLNVSVEQRTLTISGERQRERELKTEGSFHRRERRFGKFARSLQLPVDLEADKASAECRDGVLTVKIPKRAEAQPKQVQVKAA